MSLSTLEYKQFFQKWFSANAPQNAAKATVTFTLDDVVSDGEKVVAGEKTYEFDTNGTVTSGNVKVDVSIGGVSAANAIAKLLLAIMANSTDITAAAGEGTSAVISYATVGTEGNSTAVSTTCVNGTFGNGVTALSGGQYATPAKVRSFIVLDGVFYIATKGIDKYTTDGWQSFTGSLVS
jgi:hypothetical protein